MRHTGKHYLQPEPALKKGCMKIIAMGIDYLAIYPDCLFQDYACISHPIDGMYMRHLHVEKNKTKNFHEIFMYEMYTYICNEIP